MVPGGTLGSFTLGVDRLGGTIPVLKVRLADKTSRLAEDVFKEALQFWYDFCLDHVILLPNAKRRKPLFETRKKKRRARRTT